MSSPSRFQRFLRSPHSLWLIWPTVTFFALGFFSKMFYDFGDSALMLERAIYLSFEPGPSTHPLFYMIMHYPALWWGDPGIAMMNLGFGAGAAVLTLAAIVQSGTLRYRFSWAGLTAFGFLFTHTLFIKTLTPDVYAFQALLNAAIFLAMFRSERAERPHRWFFFFAVFLGLQVSNHLWAVFLLPAAAWWGINLVVCKRLSLMMLLLGGLLSLVAASAYTIPSFHMMATEGVGAWYHASLGGDEVGAKFFGYSLGEMPKALFLGVAMLVFQVPTLIWLLPLGAKRLWKKERVIFVFLVMVFVPNALASIFYKENHAYEVMLTHYQVVFIMIGAGLPLVFNFMRKRLGDYSQIGALLLIFLLIPLAVRLTAYLADSSGTIKLQNARDFPFRDESWNFVAGIPATRGWVYGEVSFQTLEEDAVILADWSYWTVLRRESEERKWATIYSTSVERDLRAFWKSPDLFDRKHYVVSNEAMYANPAKAQGAELEAVSNEHLPDEVLCYRIVRAKKAEK